MKKDISFSKQVSHVTLIYQPFLARKLCVTLNDGIKSHFNLYPVVKICPKLADFMKLIYEYFTVH